MITKEFLRSHWADFILLLTLLASGGAFTVIWERGGNPNPASDLTNARVYSSPSIPSPSHAAPPASPTVSHLVSDAVTWTPSPSRTATPSPIVHTPLPLPTAMPTLAPIFSDHRLDCEPPQFAGIQHCTKGPFEILFIDPKHPDVSIQTVLPMGFDRNGQFGECRDVSLPDSLEAGSSRGPGCYVGEFYPAERVDQMAARYPGAAAAINGDFFSPAYRHGPMGLTVRNGFRLDFDHSERALQRSSLSISTEGEVRIGIVDPELLPFPEAPWTWNPDPGKFHTTVGGLPQLVKQGRPVELHDQCLREEGWCPDTHLPRARTAVGHTRAGLLIILVVPEESGLTLPELSHLMVELGAFEAINLDGGGSSQLWYGGEHLVYSARPVAEGLIVISMPSASSADLRSVPAH